MYDRHFVSRSKLMDEGVDYSARHSHAAEETALPVVPSQPPSPQPTDNNRLILLLDPTPNRLITARQLALWGWLPLSVNTEWRGSLALALESLNEPPAAIVLEAEHPLREQVAPPNTEGYSAGRDRASKVTGRTSSAHELAGYLADYGLSPRTIPFILYTAQPLALLRTPTQFKAHLSLTRHDAEPNYREGQAQSLVECYFQLAVERPRSYATGPKYGIFGQPYPFDPAPAANEGQPSPSADLEQKWGDLLDPDLTLVGPDDALLAVLAHLTQTYFCRVCTRPLAPDEPATLVNFLQLWCRHCVAQLVGSPLVFFDHSSLSRHEGDAPVAPGSDNTLALVDHPEPGNETKENFNRLHRRFNRLYHTRYGFTPPLAGPVALYPARRLAEAASAFVTGEADEVETASPLELPTLILAATGQPAR